MNSKFSVSYWEGNSSVESYGSSVKNVSALQDTVIERPRGS